MEGDTAIRKLPLGWVWARLDDLGYWTGGGTPSKRNAEFWENGTIPWVSPKDMKADFVGEGAEKITQSALKNSAAKRVEAGSVLIVVRSGILEHTLPVSIADQPVTLNQDLRALTPYEGVSSRYVQFYLRSQNREILRRCSKDGTTVSSIEFDRLASHDVPLAPAAEQQRIVKHIEELFGEIEAGEQELEKAREALEAYRRAVLKAAVTGDLTADWRSQDTLTHVTQNIVTSREMISRSTADGLPQIPASWAWVTLGDIAIDGPKNGYSPKSSSNGSGSLALKLTATTRGVLDLSGSAVKRLAETIPDSSPLFLRDGDLLFQRGNTIEYVGISAIYEGPPNTYIYPDLMIKVRTKDANLTSWVWRVANSPYGRRYMEDHATGTAGTMPKINGAVLRRFPIPIPPHAEMVEALQRTSRSLQATGSLEQDLTSAQQSIGALRQSVLNAAFRGKLVPQDRNDEPACVLLDRCQALKGAASVNREKARKLLAR